MPDNSAERIAPGRVSIPIKDQVFEAERIAPRDFTALAGHMRQLAVRDFIQSIHDLPEELQDEMTLQLKAETLKEISTRAYMVADGGAKEDSQLERDLLCVPI